MKWFDRFTRCKIPVTTRAYVVSFPRSGHHALIGFLGKVSNFSEQYCEFYNCERHNGQSIVCPNKDLKWQSKGLDCAAGNWFLKSHDFDLSLPYNPNVRYVVQYRHPFLSIKSWYEMELSKGSHLPKWESFFKDKLQLWCDFIEKWVVSHGHKDNVMLVPYDSLSDLAQVKRIAEFAGAKLLNNLDQVTHNFYPKRTADSDNHELASLELSVRSLLDKAGLPLLYN